MSNRDDSDTSYDSAGKIALGIAPPAWKVNRETERWVGRMQAARVVRKLKARGVSANLAVIMDRIIAAIEGGEDV